MKKTAAIDRIDALRQVIALNCERAEYAGRLLDMEEETQRLKQQVVDLEAHLMSISPYDTAEVRSAWDEMRVQMLEETVESLEDRLKEVSGELEALKSKHATDALRRHVVTARVLADNARLRQELKRKDEELVRAKKLNEELQKQIADMKVVQDAFARNMRTILVHHLSTPGSTTAPTTATSS
jgi:DNA repair exonuclease SbcCD ATPase subunit